MDAVGFLGRGHGVSEGPKPGEDRVFLRRPACVGGKRMCPEVKRGPPKEGRVGARAEDRRASQGPRQGFPQGGGAVLGTSALGKAGAGVHSEGLKPKSEQWPGRGCWEEEPSVLGKCEEPGVQPPQAHSPRATTDSSHGCSRQAPLITSDPEKPRQADARGLLSAAAGLRRESSGPMRWYWCWAQSFTKPLHFCKYFQFFITRR